MVAIIQKPVVYTLVGSKRDLIDQIRDETLDEIANYLKKIKIPFNCLPDFLKNPSRYPGNKITGLKDIIERFLNKTISKHFKTIQAEGLPIKFVIDNVRKNLFEGGWDINRNLNITMATRGGDDARKALSTSRIDEPPRLIPIINKVHKVKPKSKLKKRAPKIKAFKPYKEVIELRGSCDYCGANIKIRYTSNFIHVNIRQDPARHHFCSKECKISWIFGLNEINEKISQED